MILSRIGNIPQAATGPSPHVILVWGRVLIDLLAILFCLALIIPRFMTVIYVMQPSEAETLFWLFWVLGLPLLVVMIPSVRSAIRARRTPR